MIRDSNAFTFEVYDIQSTNQNPVSSSIFANESGRVDTTVAEEMDDADKMSLRPIGILNVTIDEILQHIWLGSEVDDLSDAYFYFQRDL